MQALPRRGQSALVREERTCPWALHPTFEPCPEKLCHGPLLWCNRRFPVKLDLPTGMPFSSLLAFWSSDRITPEFAPRTWCRRLCYAVLLCTGLSLASTAGYAVTHPTTRKAASKTRKTAYHALAAPSGFHWRISKWNLMFPGSHELLVQQNQELDRSQSFRVTND